MKNICFWQMRLVVYILCLLLSGDVRAQHDDLDLAMATQPIPELAAFHDPGYFVWCGTMVRADDGTYHLYYSRWKISTGFEV